MKGQEASRMLSANAACCRAAVWVAGGRITTAFAALATNVLLARLLSPEDLGVYFLAFSLVQVGAGLGPLGLDHAVLRFLPESFWP